MADDPNLEPGQSFDIATGGVGSAAPISVATEGFIAPIIGDLILGGEAGVVFFSTQGVEYIYFGDGGLLIDGAGAFSRTLVYAGSGDLVVDGDGLISRGYTVAGVGGVITTGTASIERTFAYLGSGGFSLSGNAGVEQTVEPTAGGLIVLGGSATVSRAYAQQADGGLIIGGAGTGKLVFNALATGGLVTGGTGFINFSLGVTGDGGIVIDGEADTITTGQAGFGRGGAHNARRVPRLPSTRFEPPIYNPDDYLEPKDYLKKIQNYIDKAEKSKRQMLKHVSNGTIGVTGRGRVTAVFRDQPDGEMVIMNNPPLEPIVLDLPNVFNQGHTAIEIAELEDHLFLNDLFGLGDYKIRKGNKTRFVQQKNKSTSGAAAVKFVSGAGRVKYVNIKQRRRQQEDEDLLMGIGKRQMMSRQERDDEELRLLGLID
jgi:hypothetical protein